MRNSVVRFSLTTLLLAGLAIPVLADGLPVPWPKKVANAPKQVLQSRPILTADGLPVPWPKKVSVGPQKVTQAPVLLADGLPVPWPKK